MGAKLKVLATAVLLHFAVSGCGRSPMERLVAASRTLKTRATEDRLVGFAYTARPQRRRGAETEQAPIAIRATTASVLSHTGNEIDRQRAHALAYLLEGDAAVAVKELDALTTEHPNAVAWSDLAAARQELGTRNDDPQQYAWALAAASNAIEANASLPEAHFNFGIAAASLHLDDAAADAFRHYLSLDASSEWAIEVRDRLAKTEHGNASKSWNLLSLRMEKDALSPDIQAAARQFPQQSRTWAETVYLGNWADAYLKHHDSNAIHWLDLSRELGNAIRRSSGESLLNDAVAAIDRSDPAGRFRLAKAHTAYLKARSIYGKQNPGDAIPLLAEAEHEFAGTPMALMARQYRANALTDRDFYTEPMSLLESLRDAEPSYKALHALRLWEESLLFGRIGRVYEGLDAAQRCARIFEQIGETENASRAQMSAANAYMLLGRTDLSWQLNQRVFQTASDSGNPSALTHALHAAAWQELKDGKRDAARALLEIELRAPFDSPRLRVEALQYRLRARDSREDIREARATAITIADPALRAEALDELDVDEARHTADLNALGILTRSISFRAQRQMTLKLPETYLARARILKHFNRTSEAVTDLTAAMALIERQRATVMSDDLRDTFFDTARDVVAELFDLHVARSEYSAAFELIDRTRGRELTERLRQHDDANSSISVDGLTGKIAPGTLIVQYTLRADHLVAMTLTNRGLTTHQITAANATQAIATLNKAIDSSRDVTSLDLATSRVTDLLITPIAREIIGIDTLVVITDDVTAAVPFAVLRDPRNGEPLIRDVSIVNSPSASAYVHEAFQRKPRSPQALLLGDPKFDRIQFPNLPALPDAADEARSIRSLYDNATLLIGTDASREALLREAQHADVIHIGAHAVVNESDPSLSLIVLAPGQSKTGLLYLREIAGQHFATRPIVVLAGCGTAVRATAHGSVTSLALAFVAGGSRSVIGSMWNVDDETSRAFSFEVHRCLARGEKPSSAVRHAQLSLLRSPDKNLRNPRAWSGYQTYGVE